MKLVTIQIDLKKKIQARVRWLRKKALSEASGSPEDCSYQEQINVLQAFLFATEEKMENLNEVLGITKEESVRCKNCGEIQ